MATNAYRWIFFDDAYFTLGVSMLNRPLKIISSDGSLLKDLQESNIPGIKVEYSILTCDSPDWVPPPEAIWVLVSFVGGVAGNIAVNMLSSWLYERIKNNRPNTASIDNHNVVNNPEQIAVVINNYIQINQNHFNGTQNEK